MPQMGPLLWLVLFIYFVSLFIMYISNIYFSFLPSSFILGSVDVKSHPSISWLW